MSRMHRLYGITMPEKGVSQLVAVDLQKAEELVPKWIITILELA